MAALTSMIAENMSEEKEMTVRVIVNQIEKEESFADIWPMRPFILLLTPVLFLLITAQIALSQQSAYQDSLTQQLNSSTGKEKVILLHKACVRQLTVNSEKAIQYAEEALALSIELSEDSLETYSLHKIGLAYYYKNSWTTAIEYYQKAMQSQWGSNSDEYLAACYTNIGICYEYLGEYEKTSSYYYKAIEKGEKLNNSLQTARSRMNLGLLHIRMKAYDQAIAELSLSLPVLVATADHLNVANCHQNLMIAQGLSDNWGLAEYHYERATQIADSIGETWKLAEVESDYANLLQQNGRYDEAKGHYALSYQFTDSAASPANYFYSIYLIGKNAIYTGEYEKAEEFMLRSFSALNSLDVKVWDTEIQMDLARLYARKSDFELADGYQAEALKNEQELFKESRLNSISEMQVRYETEKKEQELAMERLKVVSQKRKRNYATIAAVLFAMAFGVVLLLIRKTRTANRELFERNRELTQRWDRLLVAPISKGDRDDELFSRISEMMGTGKLFEDPELNLDALSRKVNSNTKYVSQAIKKRTGLNFNSYVNTYRIESAKKSLHDPVKRSWSLDAVAMNCGFNNPTTFYQSFKKLTGLTPSVYRSMYATHR